MNNPSRFNKPTKNNETPNYSLRRLTAGALAATVLIGGGVSIKNMGEKAPASPSSTSQEYNDMLSTLESAQLEAGENPTDVAYRLAHDILDGEPLPDNLDAKLRSDAILEAERLRVEERHIVQPGDTVTLHVTFDDGEPYDLDVEIAVTDESTPENK